MQDNWKLQACACMGCSLYRRAYTCGDDFSSTLSDYMIIMFQDRHSGMDSHQAILPDALRVNANPFQTDLCRSRRPRKRIQAPWMGLSLPSTALDTRFPASMTI